MSIKEIAEKFQLSEQTVKNQLHSASKRLKKRIIEYDSSMIVLAVMLSMSFDNNLFLRYSIYDTFPDIARTADAEEKVQRKA